MVIGVDAGVLSVTDDRLKVGVYRVVVNALRILSSLDKKNSYRLYSFDPIDPTLMESFGERMENRVLWPVRGWASVRLPLELKIHPVDLFLGMSQMVPRGSTKSIGFVYDLGYLTRKESYSGSYEKLKKQTEEVIQKSARLLTISKAIAEDIQSTFSIDKKNIVVAYPGVDKRFTSVGRSYKAKNRYFLFVGSLKAGKNIPGLLKGFAQFLQTAAMQFDLYLAGGEYWKDPDIDITIRTLNLRSRVKKLGIVPDELLPEYYRGAVAFVSPSFHEGFCLPAAEAMVCGCPVIVSTDRAMREVVGDAGICVSANSPLELSQAMYTLSYNAKKRSASKRKGLIRSQKYTWNEFGKTLLRTIESTI